MSRQLLLQFDNDGPRAVADLHDDLAPATCDALWDVLETPATVEAVHAMFAGPEIMTGLPSSHQTFDPDLPPENQTVLPQAGDLLWFFQGANQMAGLSEELWEIGIFYGPGGRVFGPLGWTPVTIFATITDGLEAFAEACAGTRRTGTRNLQISRHQ